MKYKKKKTITMLQLWLAKGGSSETGRGWLWECSASSNLHLFRGTPLIEAYKGLCQVHDCSVHEDGDGQGCLKNGRLIKTLANVYS